MTVPQTILVVGAIAALVTWPVCPCSAGETHDAGTPPSDANQSVSTIVTWAGTGSAGFDGDGHDLLSSSLYYPKDLTFTSSGPYVVDWNNHRIRKVTAQNTFETVVGTAFLGDGPPDLSDRFPPGAPGTTCSLNHPTHVAELGDGTLVLSCWQNFKLRRYDPATGLVVVICGEDAGFSGDSFPARDAQLNLPTQTAVASDGTIYILDQRNQRVRKIDPGDIIYTVVGNGVAGFSGDGGPPSAAQINMPQGANPLPGGSIAIDAQGRLYIADTLNHRIRRADFDNNVIETIAGNGTAAFGGDGGPATDASLNTPVDIEFGPDGSLYIADTLNHRIRAVDFTTGIITTVVGNGIAGFGGDDGPPLQAMLNHPWGLAFDQAGDLYIADTMNHRIRAVRDQTVPTAHTTWGGLKSAFERR